MLDRKSITETLGFLAVIASLIFVALELRQANKIAIGTTSYEINRNWMALNDLYVTNSDVRSLIIALADREFVPKDEAQAEQAAAYARRLVNNWIAIEEAHANGIVSDALYSIAAADVKAVLAKRPGLLRTFETALGQYDTPEVGLMGPLATHKGH